MLAVLQEAGSALSPGEVRERIGGDAGLHHGGDDPVPAARQGRARPAQGGPGLPVRPGRRRAGPGGPADGRRARRRGGPGGRAGPVRVRAVRQRRGTAAPDARRTRPGRRPGRWTAEAADAPGGLPSARRPGAGGAGRPAAGRPAAAAPPRPGCSTGSALALALASSAVLGMLALSALVRIPLVDAVGGHVRAASSAAATPAVGAGRDGGGRAAGRGGRGRVPGAVAARPARSSPRTARPAACPAPGQVVVTEDDAADAYTVPGWPVPDRDHLGHAARAVRPGARGAAGPRARARRRARTTCSPSAARLAAAANPLLRPVAGAVGYTVERWADERAATATGDRPLAARAIARAALASSAAPPDRERPAGRARHRHPRGRRARSRKAPVPRARPARGRPGARRVAALLGPPPPAPGCCWSARPWCSSPSPGCPPWTRRASLHALVELAQVPGA